MTTTTPSILGRLRAYIPQRHNVTFAEALQVAEHQAAALPDLLGVRADDLNDIHVAGMPRIRIVRADLPVSGSSHWNGRAWVIALAKNDSLVRQRFTLFHELKHVIDHGRVAELYVGTRDRTPQEQAEMAADYFAGCALVPKRYLKAAWGSGIQRPAALADHFGVSEQAIRVRLSQTGLDSLRDREPAPRCARPVSTPASHRQRYRLATTGGYGRKA